MASSDLKKIEYESCSHTELDNWEVNGIIINEIPVYSWLGTTPVIACGLKVNCRFHGSHATVDSVKLSN